MIILSNDNMIIINLTHKINTLNQKNYNNIIFSLDFSSIECPACSSHEWQTHAYYLRYCDFFSRLKLRVLRIRCKNCGKTHVILVQPLIPFSSLHYDDIISVLFDNRTVDSSLFYFLYNKYSSLERNYDCYCRVNLKSYCYLFIST